jgi:hypothetical protein
MTNVVPGDSGEVRVWPWEAAIQAPYELQVGDVIAAKDLREVDLLAHNIGLVLLHGVSEFQQKGPQTPSRSWGIPTYPEWRRLAKPPSFGALPKYFLGTLEHVGVVMLDDETATMHHHGTSPARGFILTGDLKLNSKRIRSGHLVCECTISTSRVVLPSKGGATKQANIYGRYRRLPEDRAEAAVREMIEASSIVAHELIVRGLRHVYQGGAFGSKREK